VRVNQQELGGMQRAPKPSYARKKMCRERGPTKLFLVYVLADYEKTVQLFTDVGLLKTPVKCVKCYAVMKWCHEKGRTDGYK
jgi:hypothetical protein